MTDNLVPFLIESFKIEGILRPPFPGEIEATEKFLALPKVAVDDVVALVKVYQPNAVLRDKKGLNVRVGSHIAPAGGPAVVRCLTAILEQAPVNNPWHTHVAFEDLHPMTDGNGRSGRALWAWQMIRERSAGIALRLGFLHRFYYQTLENSR